MDYTNLRGRERDLDANFSGLGRTHAQHRRTYQDANRRAQTVRQELVGLNRDLNILLANSQPRARQMAADEDGILYRALTAVGDRVFGYKSTFNPRLDPDIYSVSMEGLEAARNLGSIATYEENLWEMLLIAGSRLAGGQHVMPNLYTDDKLRRVAETSNEVLHEFERPIISENIDRRIIGLTALYYFINGVTIGDRVLVSDAATGKSIEGEVKFYLRKNIPLAHVATYLHPDAIKDLFSETQAPAFGAVVKKKFYVEKVV